MISKVMMIIMLRGAEPGGAYARSGHYRQGAQHRTAPHTMHPCTTPCYGVGNHMMNHCPRYQTCNASVCLLDPIPTVHLSGEPVCFYLRSSGKRGSRTVQGRPHFRRGPSGGAGGPGEAPGHRPSGYQGGRDRIPVCWQTTAFPPEKRHFRGCAHQVATPSRHGGHLRGMRPVGTPGNRGIPWPEGIRTRLARKIVRDYFGSIVSEGEGHEQG